MFTAFSAQIVSKQVTEIRDSDHVWGGGGQSPGEDGGQPQRGVQHRHQQQQQAETGGGDGSKPWSQSWYGRPDDWKVITLINYNLLCPN